MPAEAVRAVISTSRARIALGSFAAANRGDRPCSRVGTRVPASQPFEAKLAHTNNNVLLA